MSDPQTFPSIILKRRKGSIQAVVPGHESEAQVFWHHKNSGFGLRWKLDGKWYSQWLMWSCRGGKKSYYRPMIALTRH
jgi:hypothetical protein